MTNHANKLATRGEILQPCPNVERAKPEGHGVLDRSEPAAHTDPKFTIEIANKKHDQEKTLR